MARHKDMDWNLPEGTPNSRGGHTHSWESIQAAILMDIRDELKQLNRTFSCTNFQRIPAKLDRIGRNTEKRRKQHGRP
jgi:hypothetical protein